MILTVEQMNPILAGLGTLLAFYFLKVLLMRKLRGLAKKTKNDLDDLGVELVYGVAWPTAFTLTLIVSSFWMADSPFMKWIWLKILVIVVITWQVARLSRIILDYVIGKVHADEKARTAMSSGLKTIVYFTVWIVGILVVASSLGYNISSILAGLGIGGLAVALALQNVFADLFASFSIYFDKPFTIGDYIVAGNYEGTVEKIGLKTTRLRSLRGEEVVISNKELTAKTVQNFGSLKRRRVVVNLDVSYDTPNNLLEKIPDGIDDVMQKIANVIFDRLHFKEFGEFALVHQLVYYVDSAEFVEYVKAQHEVNLAIKEWFEKQKISMAYPTQTIEVKK